MSTTCSFNIGDGKRRWMDIACYVSFDEMVEALTEVRVRYVGRVPKPAGGLFGHRRRATKNIPPVVDDLPLEFGFCINLRPSSCYGKHHTQLDKLWCDRMFDELWGHIAKGFYRDVWHKSHGVRQEIEFLSNAPYYLVASAGSVYRLRGDASYNILDHYIELSKYDLRPWTKYFLANMLQHIDAEDLWMSYDKRVEKYGKARVRPFSFSGSTSHAVLDGGDFCPQAVNRLTNMTPAQLLREMPNGTMGEEYRDCGDCSVSGRDNFWAFGTNIHPGYDTGPTLIRKWAEESGHWVEKQVHVGKDMWNGRDIYRDISGLLEIKPFIEEVIVPWDRSERNA